MSVDIAKLRALCADVPEHLTVDYRGDVVVGVDGIAAERTGVHPVGSLFPLVLRSPRGDGTTSAVAELAATARPAILALCDEVKRLRAEVERLAGELATLHTLRPVDALPDETMPVLWWRVPIEEPPWVGCMLDDRWLPDYYTHWSPLPEVTP